MDTINSNNIGCLSEDINMQYVLIYKERNDILNDVDFTEEEKIICSSIIDNLEKIAYNSINHDKCIAIPFLGTIEKSWSKDAFNKHFEEFKEARKTLTEEEYKDYVHQVMRQERDNRLEREHKIKSMQKFKTKLLPKWNKLVNKKGIAYANFWLYSITNFNIIEFDEEIQEIYESFGY